MKKVLIIAIVVGVVLTVIILGQRGGSSVSKQSRAGGSQTPVVARVPAHFEEVSSLSQLPPTLPPERFFGQARKAYQVAKEIPQTLAQLPCYCYCDESFGHKSLHSCYESTHSSECAVCVNEALLAYRLQKEQGLNPQQIRERIIAEFSRQ
ncbi:MAG TPA: CYCXC family (seleno)protein [Pyrinomonadaceae bacterium]|nr:CYCXC family (seleno)protein [Pyrinomonadaceae bacterium]